MTVTLDDEDAAAASQTAWKSLAPIRAARWEERGDVLRLRGFEGACGGGFDGASGAGFAIAGLSSVLSLVGGERGVLGGER